MNAPIFFSFFNHAQSDAHGGHISFSCVNNTFQTDWSAERPALQRAGDSSVTLQTFASHPQIPSGNGHFKCYTCCDVRGDITKPDQILFLD